MDLGRRSATNIFPDEAHRAFESIRPGHFWFESRRTALRKVLWSLHVPADALTLEVGCGDGYLLPLLPGRFRVGVDHNLRDLALARGRGINAVVAASGDRLPFRGGFGLVCAFDVLEHAEDDVGFLHGCASVLKQGGRLVLTTPAGPELWSHFDVYAGHYRRYTRRELRAVVEKAGLTIERLFPLFRLLWPLAVLNARLRWSGFVENPATAYSVGRLMNAMLRQSLALEWHVWRQSPYGRGTSWCIVACRQDSVGEEIRRA